MSKSWPIGAGVLFVGFMLVATQHDFNEFAGYLGGVLAVTGVALLAVLIPRRRLRLLAGVATGPAIWFTFLGLEDRANPTLTSGVPLGLASVGVYLSHVVFTRRSGDPAKVGALSLLEEWARPPEPPQSGPEGRRYPGRAPTTVGPETDASAEAEPTDGGVPTAASPQSSDAIPMPSGAGTPVIAPPSSAEIAASMGLPSGQSKRLLVRWALTACGLFVVCFLVALTRSARSAPVLIGWLIGVPIGAAVGSLVGAGVILLASRIPPPVKTTYWEAYRTNLAAYCVASFITFLFDVVFALSVFAPVGYLALTGLSIVVVSSLAFGQVFRRADGAPIGVGRGLAIAVIQAVVGVGIVLLVKAALP